MGIGYKQKKDRWSYGSSYSLYGDIDDDFYGYGSYYRGGSFSGAQETGLVFTNTMFSFLHDRLISTMKKTKAAFTLSIRGTDTDASMPLVVSIDPTIRTITAVSNIGNVESYLSELSKVRSLSIQSQIGYKEDNVNVNTYSMKLPVSPYEEEEAELEAVQKALDIDYVNPMLGPEHLRDLFLQYYKRTEDLDIDYNNKEAYWWYYILMRTNRELIKSKTVLDSQRSANIACSIFASLRILFGSMTEEQQKDLMDAMNNQDDLTEAQQKLLDQFDNSVDEQIDAAAKEVEKKIEKEEQAEQKKASPKNAGKGDAEIESKALEEAIKQAGVRKSDVLSFMRSAVKKATATFVGKSYPYDEPLFEAEEVDELMEYTDLLHPAFLLESTIKSYKPTVTFDVYLDASGSMSDTVSLKKKQIRCDVLCGVVAAKLQEYGLTVDTYAFESRVHKLPAKTSNVLNYHKTHGGGTSFGAVQNSIKKTGRFSLVITDGEDYADKEYYSPLSFYIFLTERVSQTPFFTELKEKGQMLFYKDGLLLPPISDGGSRYIYDKSALDRKTKNRFTAGQY